MKITCRKKIAETFKKSALLIPVYKGINLSDEVVGEHLISAIEPILNGDDFIFEKGYTSSLFIELGNKMRRVYLVNVPKEPGEYREYMEIGYEFAKLIKKDRVSDFSVISLEDIYNDDKDLMHSKYFIEGVLAGSYQFLKYNTNPPSTTLEEIEIITSLPKQKKFVDQISSEILTTFENINILKDAVLTTSNELYPMSYAKMMEDMLPDNISMEVIANDELLNNKLECIYTVGKGSVNKPCLVKMHYQGAPNTKANIAIVGKGITFDTGGENIKSMASHMHFMKSDMTGAATMYAVIRSAAQLKLPVNIYAYLPLAENKVSSTSINPGDIITAASGKTIEIHNTDAEGRLVLADALFLATQTEPEVIIDIATLTGGVVVALGELMAGFFANRRFLAKSLEDTSFNISEDVWELPLYEHYEKHLKGTHADLQNIGLQTLSQGGTIFSALFLKQFVDNYPWIHLDIAGVGFTSSEHPWLGKGATGFGVRLLLEFIKKDYLQKQ